MRNVGFVTPVARDVWRETDANTAPIPVWCGKTRKEQAIRYIYTDPHSPAFARILGTMANSRSFLEAFSCPVKEPTCELW